MFSKKKSEEDRHSYGRWHLLMKIKVECFQLLIKKQKFIFIAAGWTVSKFLIKTSYVGNVGRKLESTIKRIQNLR